MNAAGPLSAILAGLTLVLAISASAQDTPGPPSTSLQVDIALDSIRADDARQYGRHGSMRAETGRRAAVASILLSVADSLNSAGCILYVVGLAPDDPDVIWVTEVWESREAHVASLELPAVREAIEKAMPMLTGDFTGSEFHVVGGLGIREE